MHNLKNKLIKLSVLNELNLIINYHRNTIIIIHIRRKGQTKREITRKLIKKLANKIIVFHAAGTNENSRYEFISKVISATASWSVQRGLVRVARPLLWSFEKSKIFDHPGVITVLRFVSMTFRPASRCFSYARASHCYCSFRVRNEMEINKVVYLAGFYIDEPSGLFFGWFRSGTPFTCERVYFGERTIAADSAGGLYTSNQPPSQFTDSDRLYWIRLVYEIKKLIGRDGYKNHHACYCYTFFFSFSVCLMSFSICLLID